MRIHITTQEVVGWAFGAAAAGGFVVERAIPLDGIERPSLLGPALVILAIVGSLLLVWGNATRRADNATGTPSLNEWEQWWRLPLTARIVLSTVMFTALGFATLLVHSRFTYDSQTWSWTTIGLFTAIGVVSATSDHRRRHRTPRSASDAVANRSRI